MTEYNELTLPTFDLAARQGERWYPGTAAEHDEHY